MEPAQREKARKAAGRPETGIRLTYNERNLWQGSHFLSSEPRRLELRRGLTYYHESFLINQSLQTGAPPAGALADLWTYLS